MHMMSKKRIKLRRDGQSKKKSRNHTVLLTADGEVHTHKDRSLDLNQFITVQLLD